MKHLLYSAAIVCLLAVQAHGQLIQVRTYPVLSEDSYVDVPSEGRSMGRTHVAISDSLADGFSNPALLSRSGGNYLFTLARFGFWSKSDRSEQENAYIQTIEESNSALTLSAPVGAVVKCGDFAVGAFAGYELQQSKHHEFRVWGNSSTETEDARTKTKNYVVHLGASWNIPGTGLAIGGSGGYVGLGGIDGLQLLYPSSSNVTVSGGTYDARLGLAGTLGPGDLSVSGGREAMSVWHTATYETQATIYNEEKNSTWFAQAGYRYPVNDELTLGVEATGNWRAHPKIPDYPVSAPRDPGNTQAYNFGAGMNWHSGPTTFAMEYLIEPIRSNTWIIADRDRKDGKGNVIIRQGDREQENNYTFLNHIVRAGVAVAPATSFAMRFGAEARFNSLDHENVNFWSYSRRKVTPANSWSEVALTAGVDATFGRFRLMYDGEVLLGRGILDNERGIWFEDVGPLKGNDMLIVPGSGLSISPVPVFTNRLTVIYHLD
jgi:hypothetical protein